MRAGISRSWWALGLHLFTAIFATERSTRFGPDATDSARVCAAAQVTLILLGWAFAQYPNLVEPDITLTSAAAPRITLQLLLGALAAGAILLFPLLLLLVQDFQNSEVLTTKTLSAHNKKMSAFGLWVKTCR